MKTYEEQLKEPPRDYFLHLDTNTGEVCHAHPKSVKLRTSHFHEIILVREVKPTQNSGFKKKNR